jgi:pimeloyl-ACP methyl ester carboxylesterase
VSKEPSEATEAGGPRQLRGCPSLEAAGRRLEYEWIGPGPEAAPTLVFLHDGLGCVGTWRDFPAALAAATGCGALVYSRSGYGGSQALPGPWPRRFMHDEALEVLPAVLAALCVRDGFLVGHSDGGSISLIYAASLAAAPGSRPRAHRSHRSRRSQPSHASNWLRGIVLEAPHVYVEAASLESIAKLPGLYRHTDLWPRMVRYHGANAENCFDSWVDAWLRPEFLSWSIVDLLSKVRCPVLDIQGDDDAFGTAAQLEAIASGCGGPTEILVLPGCGHTPHHQQREETLAAMIRFLRPLL